MVSWHSEIEGMLMREDSKREFWVLLRIDVKAVLGQTGDAGNEILLLPSEK